jgi:hypothetical protein
MAGGKEPTMNPSALSAVTPPIGDHIATTSPSSSATRHRLQSVGAVVTGLLTTVVSSTAIDAVLHATGVYPESGQPMVDELFLLAVAYRLVCGAAGGYVAARIATVRPMIHAATLGVTGTIPSTAGAAATWAAGPNSDLTGIRSSSL